MRALIIPHSLDYSGAPIASLALARALRDLDIDVSVFSQSGGQLSSSMHALNIAIVDRIDLDYDLYVTVTVLRLDVARELRRRGKNVWVWLHESPSFKNFSPHPAFRIEGGALDYFDLVICASDTQRKSFLELFPRSRCITLENCATADLFEERTFCLPDQPYFVYPGRIEERKGQRRFLQALAKTRQSDLAIVFVGASSDDLSQISSEFPSSCRVLATNSVTPHEAHFMIARCQGLVTMSLAEVKPLTIIDALWHGKPCLLPDAPEFREFQSCALVAYHKDFLPDLSTVTFDDEKRHEALRAIRQVHSFVSFRSRVKMLLQICRRNLL